MSGVPLPAPSLTLVYRLEATLGQPLDLGDVAQGHRRIVNATAFTLRLLRVSSGSLKGETNPRRVTARLSLRHSA